MKRVKTIALIAMILSGASLCGGYLLSGVISVMTAGRVSSVGIIGGADGPTAIFVTARPTPHVVIAIGVFVVALAVWLTLHIRSMK